MSVVAIAESYGSRGDEIGYETARALGWEYADREIIAKAAEHYGEGVADLYRVTEERPTLWERFTVSKRHYLAYVEATIFEMAARGDIVLVGHGAAVLLRSLPHVLRVRVTGPEAARAQRVRHTDRLVDSAALDIVRESDRERLSRIRFLYHVDLDDPLLYDLVINTERLDVPEAVALVRDALRAERLQPTDASREAARDASVAAQARAWLVRHGETRHLRLTVTVEEGRLTVAGTVDSEAQRSAALAVLRAVTGTVVDRIVVLTPARPFVA